MAENSKGGILNKTEKFLRRRKTKVLQSLGKTGRTTDEQILEDSLRLEKQQEIANKFQKDLRHYIHTAKALALASKTFYTTLSETYEPEWEGRSQVDEILTSVDVLWQDYLQKLQEQIQDPLTKYLAVIPQIKARVSKRGRKLIDYDNSKHNLDVQQNAKKKDEAKITKAQEDLDQAKRIYDELNNELHTELPEFYNSRVTFYGNAFQHMFEAEHIFHQEIGKGAEKVAEASEKLSKDNESFTYTPRRNIHHTISHESDEHMPNGHSENGNSGYESPQPDSPGPSDTPNKAPEPESQGPIPAPRETPIKADVTVENGEKEVDTSKESIEEGLGDYENTDLSQQQSSRQSAEVQEVKRQSAEVQEVKRQSAEVQEVKVTENEPATSEQPKEEPKVNGVDLDTSTEQDLPDYPPPQPPATEPPTQLKESPKEEKTDIVNAVNDDEDDDEDPNRDSLYQVPPPAKPLEALPERYLKTVIATHPYKGEDDDELTFESGEVIHCVSYEDPDDQDPGWLMGVRKSDNKRGVFPENFTRPV